MLIQLTLLISLAIAACTATAAAAKVHTVTIEAMKFSPDSLVIKKGDTVKWMNKDIVPHTATDSKKNFDSGMLSSDATWSYKASVTGKFVYVCTFHPMMKAEITVK